MTSEQIFEQGSVGHLNLDGLKGGLQAAENELISLQDSTEKAEAENITLKLPVQDAQLVELLRRNLDDTTEGCEVVISDDGSLIVTGTEENTKNCVEFLSGVYGVNADASSAVSDDVTSLSASAPISNVVRPSSGSATLTLKPPDLGVISKPWTSSGDGTLGIDELIWNWIQKDAERKSKVDRLCATHGVSIGVIIPNVQDVDDDLEMYERSVQLVLTGGDTEKCRVELKELVDEYGLSTTRKKGSCNEEAYQRLIKMLPSINKGACQVGLSNKSITVIGRKEDVDASAAKLLRYGVRFEGMMTDEDRRMAEARKPRENPFANFVPPGAQKPMTQGAFPSGQPFLMGGPSQAMGRGGMSEEAMNSEYEALALASSLGSEDGRQACIPVEMILWRYINHSKQSELAELSENFKVFIRQNEPSTTGTRASDHVFITFSGESAEMVDLGRQAFLELMEHLRSQINMALLPIKLDGEGMEAVMQGGERAQKLAQAFQVIKSQFSTVDTLVECVSEGILIISPSHKAQEAQERVVNFMKNFQGADQQGGAGFPGMGQRLGQGGAQMMGGDGFGPGRALNAIHGPAVIKELPNEEETGPRAELKYVQSTTVRASSDRSKTTRTSSSGASSNNKTSGLDVRVSETDSSAGQGGYCSACCATPQNTPGECTDSGNCGHTYCLSCIELYFGCKDMECPSCGLSTSDNEHSGAGAKRTQPSDGVMLVNEDSSFKLPGFDKTSSGTIVVTYVFPAGMQSEDMPSPGQKYESITQTAFLPKNEEGLQIVRMLRKAFDSRILFTYGETGQITFNGVRHKTNIYGGPQQSGYPDPVYLRRVKNDLHSKRIRLL